MKNLVIGVSPESSLKLLGSFADIIMLDKDPLPKIMPSYDTLYLRSHFAQPETLPQNFRLEIEDLVQRAKLENPSLKFVDGMDNVDALLAFEDKWQQYKTFRDLMPMTKLFNDRSVSAFQRPVFKKRLSSRGTGVTWDLEKVSGPFDDWLAQESLDIMQELRVYVICGEVYSIGVVRQSKTAHQKTQAVDFRALTKDEIEFSSQVSRRAPGLDFIGLDVARTADGMLYLMEVNRSPGFAAFDRLTSVNLGAILYEKL